MENLDRLVALEDLRALKARYFLYVDSKRWREWGDLFEPDATGDFNDDSPGFVVQGREALVSSISAALGPALTLHHGHTPILDVLSPTEATGIWTMQDWLRWPDGIETPQPGVRAIDGWGHYHETYVKSEAGWRIKTLRLTRMLLTKG